MSRPTPRQVLRAYAENRASQDAVMRALMEHDGWLAPIDLLTPDEHIELPGTAIVHNQQWAYPEGELWLFTDREAADRAAAAGAALGMYTDQVPAARLFGRIPAGVQKIKINNFGPLEEFWFIGADAFGLATGWMAAIAAEQTLARGAEAAAADGAALARLARHTWLLYLDGTSHGVVGLPDIAGLDSAGVMFAAPDGRDRFRGAVPAEARVGFRRAWGEGSVVFRYLLGQGFDGVLLNPAGPNAAIVVPMALLQAVLDAHPPVEGSRIQLAPELEA